MGAGALNIFIIVFTAIFVTVVVVVLILLILDQKKFNEYRCIIWERDGFDQIKETYDKAGIFVDKKTKNKRLFLKKNNVGLSPDEIPYVPTYGGKKVIYLFRNGLKNFYFIKPNPTLTANPGVGISFSVGEEDVNWAVNAYERQKLLFQHNTLMQYLPFIALAFVSIIILIIFIYFFKNFEVLKQLGIDLKETAQILAQSKGVATIQ